MLHAHLLHAVRSAARLAIYAHIHQERVRRGADPADLPTGLALVRLLAGRRAWQAWLAEALDERRRDGATTDRRDDRLLAHLVRASQ